MYDILSRDGLSIRILSELSFRSTMGLNLKYNLHYFEKERLFEELKDICRWYDNTEYMENIVVDYRIKSVQSAIMKYERYYPDHQFRKVFNDILGLRSLCDHYEEIWQLKKNKHIRIADMSHGKPKDDGYRGVHVYFQLDNMHYPIEIQYNTYYDRQMNNWLHKYIYKKDYAISVGLYLRKAFEDGRIKTETEFQEVLKNVLLNSKKG